MSITKIFILSAFVLIIGYDIYADSHGLGTISHVLLQWSLVSMTLPYFVGVLGGHLFWPQKYQTAQNWPWLVAILISCVLRDFCFWGEATTLYPIGWLLLGLPSGAFLWGQQNG